MTVKSTMIERLQELFPDADKVRISTPCNRMFLIIGYKRNTKDAAGQWVDQDGNARDWEYIEEKAVASGDTEQELMDDAMDYKAVGRLTWQEYFAGERRDAERASATRKDAT